MASAPGDVLDYIPERYHCREGVAVVMESGTPVDTFWSLSGDSHALTDAERATAGLRFRLSDYRKLGESWDDKKAEWLTYAPADRQVITSQHGLQRTYYVRIGSEPDLATQISNARERVAEAEAEVRAAEGFLERRREDLAELEARP